MTFDAGTARAAYLLDVEQPKRAAAELRALFAAIKRDAAGIGAPSGIGTGGGGGQAAALTQQSAAAARASSGLERLRDSEIRAARASGEHERALFLINNQLRGAEPNTVRYNNLLSQQASVTNQTTRATQLGSSAADTFKSNLLGVIGPAALVTAGIALAGRAVQSFGEAFDFKNKLDATNQSIAAQLVGVRDSARVFDEARQFGDRYKITQVETAAILQNSIGVLRVSTSSVGDLEAALLRLGSRDPSKPISEASRALRELASGDVTSIKELFNVPAAQALKMKNEIAGGGDAVVVLTKFLDDAGNGMDVLERRAKGVQGALNDAAIASEKLQLAQAELANSAGAVALIQGRTQFTTGLARVLNFDTAGFAEAGRALAARTEGQKAYDAAIQQGLPAQEAQNRATAAYAAEAQRLNPIQNVLNQAITEAGNAVAALSPVLQGLAAIHGAAAAGANVQANAERGLAGELNGVQRQALGAQGALAVFQANQKTMIARGQQEIGRVASILGKGAGADQIAENARIHAAQLQFDLAAAKTNAQKIAVLQKQLAGTRDATERLQLRTQILNLQQSGVARVSAAARTGQQLQSLEQNSGLQLANTQRENLERLRDQQEDFDVGRSRKQEDFDRARIRLLAGGRRFEAARLGEDFARDQRRAREDFDRQRGRTLRNNQEGTGDIDARTDLRQDQILARARLARGGGGGGAAIGRGGIGAAGRGGGGLPALPGGGGSTIPLILKIQLTSLPLQIDGKTFIDATWSEIEQRVDLDLSEELATIGIVLPPGGTQTVVAGAP